MSARLAQSHLQHLAHQFERRPLVPPGLDQNVEDLALGIHGTPELNQATIDLELDFVEMPDGMRLWPVQARRPPPRNSVCGCLTEILQQLKPCYISSLPGFCLQSPAMTKMRALLLIVASWASGVWQASSYRRIQRLCVPAALFPCAKREPYHLGLVIQPAHSAAYALRHLDFHARNPVLHWLCLSRVARQGHDGRCRSALSERSLFSV
jgi:hypothetical protein